MAQTILKLKLDIDDDTAGHLDQIALLCRQGVNAAVEDWLLRARGKRRRSKKQMGRKGDGLHPSTELYHAITATVPSLGTTPATCLAGKLWSTMNAKLDWRDRVGDGCDRNKRRADAILEHQLRPPFTTASQIPAANKHTRLIFGDAISVHVRDVLRDCEQTDLYLPIAGKGLPAGHKRIIRQVIDGEQKLSDSYLTKKAIRGAREAWFFFLVANTPDACQLPEDIVIELRPEYGDGGRPFVLRLPSGRRWTVGDGRYLLAQSTRLIGLRKMVGYRYRYGNGNGHGRAKVDRAVRLRNLQLRNVRDEFRRRLINDILRQCQRHGAGTLRYLEPTNPAKDKCWFSRHGLEFDWTRFVGDLKNAAKRRGVLVDVPRKGRITITQIIQEEKEREAAKAGAAL